MAVSKNQPPESVAAAAEAGLALFAENRVQEAKAKIGRCPGRLRWHLVGHLQSNKCRDAVHFFEMIESVDSLELAQEIDKWANKSAKTMPLLLEVNVAGEASKFGYRPDALLAELKAINRPEKDRDPWVDDDRALDPRAGEGAARFPPTAGSQNPMRANPGCSPAPSKHGDER